ncbi:MAG: MoaD/ThiS family protein [Saprospiraceae bacterium]|nr:MoaD/ThiS family protein [Saprospiraceae bacterium]
MRVKILAFGVAKDILGGRVLELDLPEKISVAELKDHLVDRYPDFVKLRSLALAVNQEYVKDSILIRQSDEIVIIPPVSGG